MAEQAHANALAPEKRRDWILFSIAGFMGVLLVIAVILGISMAPSMTPVVIPDQYVPQIPVVDWAAVFGSAVFRYGLILLIAVLTLQILDKYLQQRNWLEVAQ